MFLARKSVVAPNPSYISNIKQIASQLNGNQALKANSVIKQRTDSNRNDVSSSK